MRMIWGALILMCTTINASGRFTHEPAGGVAGGANIAPCILVNATAAALDGARVVLSLGRGCPAGAKLLGGNASAAIGVGGVADFGAAPLRSNAAGNYTLDAWLLEKERVDGGLLDLAEHQQIATLGARGWESFEAAGRTFLAVANKRNGTSNSIMSAIYV